jgi:hypothetical protein
MLKYKISSIVDSGLDTGIITNLLKDSVVFLEKKICCNIKYTKYYNLCYVSSYKSTLKNGFDEQSYDNNNIYLYGFDHITMSDDFESIMNYLRYSVSWLIPYEYLDIDKDNGDMVTYLPSNKVKIVINKGLDLWDNKYRKSIKIGKFLNNLFGDKLTKHQIELLVNDYKASNIVFNDDNFRIVYGDDIVYWYDETNYYNVNKGILYKSCMRYSRKGYKIKFYAENKDVVGLMILTNGGKLYARALVWKTDKGTYMDRVYYVDDFYKNYFYKYALKNGWGVYKDKDKLDMVVKNVDIGSSNGYRCNLPYMDTFRYLYRDKYDNYNLSNNRSNKYSNKYLDCV